MIFPLKPGTENEPITESERLEREKNLEETVRHYLPEVVSAVEDAKEKDADVAFHQDSFAAGYHYDEYVLLGMAVKYIGLSGLRVMFVGENYSSYREKP